MMRAPGLPTVRAVLCVIAGAGFLAVLAACKKTERDVRPELGTTRALENPTKLATQDSARYPHLLVHNPAPNPEAPAFHVVQTPEIRIGGRSDADVRKELWNVRDALVTPNGNLIVVMDAGREIRVFNAAGAFLRTVGRTGPGPGEFSNISRIVLLPGDTLVAHDSPRGSLIFYDSAFRYVRRVSTGSRMVCCTADGRFLKAEGQGIFGRSRRWPEGRDSAMWRIMRSDGTASEATPFTLPESDAPEFVITEWEFGGGMRSMSLPLVPFSRESFVVLGPDVAIHSSPDYFEYRVYDSTGTLTRAVRAAAPVIKPTAEDIAHARDRFVGAQNRNAHQFLVKKWERLKLPSSMPAFGRIIADDSGHVWIRNYDPPRVLPDSLSDRTGTVGQWWARFDENGRLLGTMRIPDWHSVVAITGGRVILRNIEMVDGFTWLSVHRILGAGNESVR